MANFDEFSHYGGMGFIKGDMMCPPAQNLQLIKSFADRWISL
jgi:hypothetical protein